MPVSQISRGQLFSVPDGTKGFDCNTPLTTATAAAFVAHGYRFVLRYVPRNISHRNDLTRDEVDVLVTAGLGLMVVQHVESADSWTPIHETGTAYGTVAVQQAQQAGVPPGTMLWLDLEGVAVGTPAQIVIDYCNAWNLVVSSAGFVSGLYVGWHAGLTAHELYHALSVTRYWNSYNLNADEYPAIRGTCLSQHAATPADRPSGVTIEFDTDIAHTDALGGTVTVFAPDAWAALPPCTP